ncbi:MAG TPA: VWA domain-containing protein [Opitutaceae bacterium]|nr:VWA domain-containing protein [Opitutaceae bacterium]
MRLVRVFFFLTLSVAITCCAEPALKLEAVTDRDLYLADAGNLIYTQINLSSAIESPRARSKSIRNIAFVIDRSGSMAGEPIQAIRQAIPIALNSLSERDVVSVVLFGSEVKALIEARRRDQLKDFDALLSQTEPVGGASLYDALNQGAAQLRRYAGVNTVNQLILISDGQPTKGPREFDDFSRLVELFAKENISVSAIGVGMEFNEDLLAGIARAGNGRFLYVESATKLSEVLQAELDPERQLVARDIVLTIDFGRGCEKAETYGWTPADVKEQNVSYRIPYFFAGQTLRLLTSAKMRPRRGSFELAKIKLSWIEVSNGATQQTILPVQVVLDGDLEAVRRSANVAVLRTTVNTVISEGLERSIEEIDKGDFRRAIRALRRARADALSLNFRVDDEEAIASIKRLETYLAEVQKRGMNRLDRKVLRSGLFNQFDSPTAENKADN